MEQTKKLASFLAEAVNVGAQLLAKKGVFVVFQLSDEAMSLGSFDAVAFKAEWAGKDVKKNMQEVVSVIQGKLALENTDLQAKINSWLEVSIDAASALTECVVVVDKVKALV